NARSLITIPLPPRSPLFPYTTLFRSDAEVRGTQEFLARQYGLPVRHFPHTNFSLDRDGETVQLTRPDGTVADQVPPVAVPRDVSDRKSTRLNSSHDQSSYAVFCLKKK